MRIEGRDLVDFGERQLHLLGERRKMCRRQMSVVVLDQMQMLDEEVAPERPISEQGSHFRERRGINLAALRGAARPPLATGRLSVHDLDLFQLNTLTRFYQNSPTIRPSA